jgi:hypothetical protein
MNITFDGTQAPGFLLVILVGGFFWEMGKVAARGLLATLAQFRPQFRWIERTLP